MGGMKQARIPINQADNGSYYISIPPSLSPTGKRRRQFFERKSDAQAERIRLLAVQRRWGAAGSMLSPSESEDARRALDALEGTGLNLFAAVTELLDLKQIRRQSFTVVEVLAKAKAVKLGLEPSPLPTASSNPKELRPATVKNIERFYAGAMAAFEGVHSVDLDTVKAKTLLRRIFKANSTFDAAVSYIRPAFALAVEAGWMPSNPLEKVQKEHRRKRINDCLRTTDEVQKVLAACLDWRKDEKAPDYCKVDCRSALVPFAILLFAGVRPAGEMLLLSWEDIRLDHNLIRVPDETSKTETLRFVEISPNLKAWIETVPPNKRKGRIIPADWQKKYKAVRRMSGLNKRSADVTRKTFASMFLASGRSMDDLRQQLGHTTEDTAKEYYLAAVEVHEARRFWQIGPEGWTPFKTVKKTGVASA